MANERWRAAHLDPGCGGYYSTKPCRANTCESRDDYCAAHKAALEPEPDEELDEELYRAHGVWVVGVRGRSVHGGRHGS